jgi:hypothetical protein
MPEPRDVSAASKFKNPHLGLKVVVGVGGQAVLLLAGDGGAPDARLVRPAPAAALPCLLLDSPRQGRQGTPPEAQVQGRGGALHLHWAWGAG